MSEHIVTEMQDAIAYAIAELAPLFAVMQDRCADEEHLATMEDVLAMLCRAQAIAAGQLEMVMMEATP